jgi:[acyl-carrier-protein] S-malonyltransferase
MGRDLFQQSSAARSVFLQADEVLGFALSEICFKGPEERLADTLVTQPAIVTMSLACLAAAIESGLIDARPALVAGHSVGEYAGLIAAGCLSFADGLLLVQQRARLMATAAADTAGSMAAVIGLNESAVASICAEEGIDVCNLNLPAQTVIGGSVEAVGRAMARAKAAGAARVVALNVSGAFHSRLMQSASAGMAAAVQAANINDAEIRIVANSSAEILSSAAGVAAELASQVSQPVRWHESVVRMAEAGVTRFIEFGPGKVLTGLVRRILPGASLANVSGLSDLSRAAGV